MSIKKAGLEKVELVSPTQDMDKCLAFCEYSNENLSNRNTGIFFEYLKVH